MAAIADPLVPWFDLWKRSTQLAASLPPFVDPRFDLFDTPCPWMPSAMIETQQMLWERVFTVGEMWWTLWLGTCSPAALLSTRGWDGHDSRRQARPAEPALERKNASQEPASKRMRQG